MPPPTGPRLPSSPAAVGSAGTALAPPCPSVPQPAWPAPCNLQRRLQGYQQALRRACFRAWPPGQGRLLRSPHRRPARMRLAAGHPHGLRPAAAPTHSQRLLQASAAVGEAGSVPPRRARCLVAAPRCGGPPRLHCASRACHALGPGGGRRRAPPPLVAPLCFSHPPPAPLRPAPAARRDPATQAGGASTRWRPPGAEAHRARRAAGAHQQAPATSPLPRSPRQLQRR